MAFTAKTWADGPGGGTPITAAELNRIEAAARTASRALDTHDRGRKVPEAHTFWGSKANTTTIPATEDTGQPVVLSVTTGAVAKVNKGAITYTPPASGGSGFYHQFHGDAPITRIGMRFTMGGERVGTTNQGAFCAATMNKQLDLTNPTFKINVHFQIGPTGYAVATVDTSSGTAVFDFVKVGSFNPPLAIDDTVYEMEVFRVGSTITMVMPDGSIVTDTSSKYADANFVGNWGFVEAALVNSATDNIPSIVEHWWDTGVQYPPRKGPAAAPDRWKLVKYNNTPAAIPVAATPYGAAAVTGLLSPSFTIPASGKVLCHIAFNLTTTAAAAFYIQAFVSVAGGATIQNYEQILSPASYIGMRRAQATVLISGLAPGSTGIAGVGLMSSVASSGNIIQDNGNASLLTVEPVI